MWCVCLWVCLSLCVFGLLCKCAWSFHDIEFRSSQIRGFVFFFDFIKKWYMAILYHVLYSSLCYVMQCRSLLEITRSNSVFFRCLEYFQMIFLNQIGNRLLLRNFLGHFLKQYSNHSSKTILLELPQGWLLQTKHCLQAQHAHQ